MNNDNHKFEITSLDKGLALLQAIAKDRGKTSFKTISERLDLPTSTAHRLLATLERHGLVSRIGRGHYDIGKSIPDLTGGRNAQDLLIQIARPLLRRLSKALRHTVHLGILENDMVTYLIKVVHDNSEDEGLLTREATQLEAYCSGIGKVLLAQLPPLELKKYLANGPFIPLTKYTITDPQKLLSTIKTAQKKGFALDDREVSENLYCLAVPVGDFNDEITIGLSVSMEWSLDIKGETPIILEHLHKTSALISDKFFATN